MYFCTSFLFALLVLPGLSNALQSFVYRHFGHAKVYTPSPPGQGPCASVNNATDYVVAVSAYWFNFDYPGGNPICGSSVDITHTTTLKTVTAKVLDTCRECKQGDITLSQAAFYKIGGSSQNGVIAVQWLQ
ncbi:RlpA-like double-psi beta-barrel-protein domain-containing protein-containing protein [Cytidiella melzeri]|nr:RlpA-like double-psi beta-barrel-protein domain-containing protein-containing protein [Cytidiella melzeri]